MAMATCSFFFFGLPNGLLATYNNATIPAATGFGQDILNSFPAQRAFAGAYFRFTR
jgi:hypothetical protein